MQIVRIWERTREARSFEQSYALGNPDELSAICRHRVTSLKRDESQEFQFALRWWVPVLVPIGFHRFDNIQISSKHYNRSSDSSYSCGEKRAMWRYISIATKLISMPVLCPSIQSSRSSHFTLLTPLFIMRNGISSNGLFIFHRIARTDRAKKLFDYFYPFVRDPPFCYRIQKYRKNLRRYWNRMCSVEKNYEPLKAKF